jgi:hypothetical protein
MPSEDKIELLLNQVVSGLADLKQQVATLQNDVKGIKREFGDFKTTTETRFSYLDYLKEVGGMAYKTPARVPSGHALIEPRSEWRPPKPFDR